MNFSSIKKNFSINKASELLYFIVLSLYLVHAALKNTTFDLSIIGETDRLFVVLFLVALLLQWLTHLHDKKTIIIGICLICVAYVAYLQNTYIAILFWALLMAGQIGINYKKTLKLWTILISIVILLAAIAALSGIIENYVYFQQRGNGYSIRSSLGIIYPTDCATWILFCVAFVWATWERISNGIMLIISVLVMVIVHYYTDSNTATICSGILFAFIATDSIGQYVLSERKKERLYKIIDGISYMVMPIMAGLMIILTIMYGRGSGLAYRVNEIIDNRLSMGWNAFSQYGINPFGAFFKMYGFGGGNIASGKGYNFLDCSYINILIRHGYVLLVLYILLWMYMVNRIIKSGNRRLLLVAIFVAVQSAEEHHLAEMIYNPLFLLFFSDFCDKDRNEWTREWNIKRLIVSTLTVIICVWISPLLFDCIGTIAQIEKIGVKAAVQVVENDEAAIRIIKENKTAPFYVDYLPLFYRKKYGGLSNSFYYGDDYARINRCNILMNNKIESIPLLQRYFMYVELSDQTALYSNDYSVVAALRNAGYKVNGYYSSTRFGTINKAGKVKNIKLTPGKYSIDITVEMIGSYDVEAKEKVCTVYIESFNQDETVRLAKKTLSNKNFIDGVAQANLEIENDSDFEIRIKIKNRNEYETRVVTCSYEKKTDADINYYLDDNNRILREEYYDSEGKRMLTDAGYFACEHYYKDERNNSVKFFDQMDNPVIISEGYSEINRLYDDNNNVVYETYFDEVGNPMVSVNGVYGIKYGYDEHGNRTELIYCDQKGNPMNNIHGYAIAHLIYDDQRHIIHEEYFNANGEPTQTNMGIATVDRIFNDEGDVSSEIFYNLDGDIIK